MTFQQRLRKCQQSGNLTVADLARWFDRQNATVRAWVEDGVNPGGGPMDKQHAASLLVLLESLIKAKRGFPIPRLGPKDRIVHLLKIRKAVMP